MTGGSETKKHGLQTKDADTGRDNCNCAAQLQRN